MRAAILVFAVASWGLLCPDCLAQANPSPSKTETTATQTSSAEQNAPAVRSLELKETIPLAYASRGPFGSGIKCDGSSNIFVPMAIFNSDGTVRSTVLLEILPDSKSAKTFGSQPLSGSDYPNPWIGYFDVDADGTVYALVETHENGKPGDKQWANPQYFIERFKSDGSTDSVVHLDYPPGAGTGGIQIDQFGVFHDGSLILAGQQGNASNEYEPFTAVYDSNGRFIRSVELSDDVPSDQALKAQHASSAQRDAAGSAIVFGGMVGSRDGNVYLLRDSQPVRLYGVDSSGEAVKHFQLSPPSAGLRVSSVGVAGANSLLLFFGHPPPEHPGEKFVPISENLVGVFNTVSGQFDAVYKQPKGFRIPACGDQHGGLFYIGSTTDRHLAVFDYSP